MSNAQGTGSGTFLQKGIERSVLQSFRSLEEDPMDLGQVGVEGDTCPHSEALCQGITEVVGESYVGLSPIILQVCCISISNGGTNRFSTRSQVWVLEDKDILYSKTKSNPDMQRKSEIKLATSVILAFDMNLNGQPRPTYQ